MTAYYNEHDRLAAAWLRELIRRGLIAPGDVDERDIREVKADELRRYTQVHLFAGVGGWSAALRLAGWPDDRPVWTGSCPCPPFSCAGKKRTCPACASQVLIPHPFRTGVFVCADCDHAWHADGRHLWPEMLRLIDAAGPDAVLGEQVAGIDGGWWLAGVRASLEGVGYRVRADDLPAAGVASPQIRQRLYWVADAGHVQAGRATMLVEAEGWRSLGHATGRGVQSSRLDNPIGARLEGHGGHGDDGREPGRLDTRQDRSTAEAGGTGGVGHTASDEAYAAKQGQQQLRDRLLFGHWSDYSIVLCRNPRGGPPIARRVERGVSPLVAGLPKGMVRGGDSGASVDANATAEARRMRLSGYGNSIVPQLAAAFVKAYMETAT